MGIDPNQKRPEMPEQDPAERARNFEEVALGYTPQMAMEEAKRCLKCPVPQCVTGCPVNINIPAFIKKIEEGDFQGAVDVIREKNNLPAVTGRVCPQETQCEAKCVMGIQYEPIAIGRLERFVADWERANGRREPPKRAEPIGKKVAVVGSGPGGLTCAGDLAKMGVDVHLFEAFHKPGGVLVYGIPEFRLPKDIVAQEVEYVKSLGVEIETDVVVGAAISLEELRKEYDAVYIGVGAGTPKFLGIPGENLSGVYSANEFLTRVNLMKAYKFPKYDTPAWVGRRVAVIGGGNVAMDAARTALRMGAYKVMIVYRRTFDEMPARLEERHHARQEGIDFVLLTNPVEVIGNESKWVKGLKCLKMELSEPDESGRRRPVPVEGSEHIIPCDMVIFAVGTESNKILRNSAKELEYNKWGYIVADPETGATNLEGVYAGGDIVTGAATVIEAMGAGKRAAAAIYEYLTKN